MIYYIADTHFGHSNSIVIDKRPFHDVEEMEKVITGLWNSKVRENDDVYIVGDVAYKSKKDPYEIISRLKGRKHLIIGNHDNDSILKDERVMKLFVSIDKVLTITDFDKRIVLSHYPMEDWEGRSRGVLHIYGHIHGDTGKTWEKMSRLSNCYNAGCMINGYAPVPLHVLIENNRIFNMTAKKKEKKK